MWDIAIFVINKIKEAIDSVKSVAEEIKTNTAGNTTASASGTLSQKLTHIIEVLTTGSVKESLDLIEVQTSTFVKSVQRGNLIGNKNTKEITIDINEVNPDKCIVILDGVVGSSTPVVLFSTSLTSTQLSIICNAPHTDDLMRTCSWQLIEFY